MKNILTWVNELYKSKEKEFEPRLTIFPDGKKEWRLNGLYHREDGPAVIYPDGFEQWFFNGLIHREDGPATISFDGSKMWLLNNLWHRIDGPAIIWHGKPPIWAVKNDSYAKQKLWFDRLLKEYLK